METKKRRNKQSCCILSNHNLSTRSRITEQILVRFFHSCSWLLFALMRSILNSYFKTNSLMLCTSTNNKIDCFEIIPFRFITSSSSGSEDLILVTGLWVFSFDLDRIAVSVLRLFQIISCWFHSFINFRHYWLKIRTYSNLRNCSCLLGTLEDWFRYTKMGVEAEILTQPQQVHYFCTDFSFEKGNFTSLC